jgi:ABC-type transport system involved in multi-copper enzyme maturation permease subunit
MDIEPGAPVKPLPQGRWNLIQRLTENPVIQKELRGRMRGRQALLMLTGYLALIALVIGLVYVSMATASPSAMSDPDYRQAAGKAIFGTVVILELLLVSLIGPALTAGAISSGRERQTFDLLRTTTLPARALVLGKLGAALAFLLLLVFAALPIEAIAFLVGGVGPAEMLISSLMLVVTAIFYCTLGLFFSSFMKRTLGATVSAYAAIVLSFVLLGLMFFLIALFGGGSLGTSQNRAWMESFFSIVTWVLVCTNPLLAAIASEAILVSDQSLFVTTTQLYGSRSITLPSPWIPYVIIYLALTLLMIQMSIRFVRRPER